MDLKTGYNFRVYTDKIDKHIVSIECKNFDLIGGNIYTIYFYYHNNDYCTRFLYDINENKFFAFENGNFLTKRQQQLLLNKIKQVNEIETKIKELQNTTQNINIKKL